MRGRLPALLGQQPLPVLTVGRTAGHGAKQVRVDLNHLVHPYGGWKKMGFERSEG